jgi:hypothetical protein
MLASIYKRANRLDVLEQLILKLPKDIRKQIEKKTNTINNHKFQIREQYKNISKHTSKTSSLTSEDPKLHEIDERFNEMLLKMYKQNLYKYLKTLWTRSDLTLEEKYTLQYIDFNPRMLIIFDDCAAQFKPVFNTDVFNQYFYLNRHNFITVFIACQDDTDLPTNLRKNAFVSFFAEPIVCQSNFERASNNFSKPMKEKVKRIISFVFKERHRKLAYIRNDETGQHFYHYSFPQPGMFQFGSPALYDLCKAVSNQGFNMNKDNPYFNVFNITI